MQRVMICTILALCGFALVAVQVSADVVIRLPNGQVIIVPAPVNVQVNKAGVLVEAPLTKVEINKAMPLPGAKKMDAAEPPLPAPRPLPAVKLTDAPVAPIEFAKSFKATGAATNYEVLFQHPVSDIAVSVTFALPEGSPQVTYNANALRFDYGQGREVVLNFGDANRVVVTQK